MNVIMWLLGAIVVIVAGILVLKFVFPEVWAKFDRRKKPSTQVTPPKSKPKNEQPKVILSEASPTTPKRGRPSVILLVEDSPTILLTLRKILERWNYKVITSSNGRKAWLELQKHKPDLVISDIDMPELNGIELVRLMRSDLMLIDVPVLLITGNAHFHLQASQEAGVNGLLSKPFEDKSLIDQVRYLLQE